MPPFGDLLVCAISRQKRQEVRGFDEVIARADADFAASGLLDTSLVRLGLLATLPTTDVAGVIGWVSKARYDGSLLRLADYLTEPVTIR